MARAFFSHCIRDRDGNLKRETRVTPNLRTTAGIDWQAAIMGKATAQPPGAQYIALSNDLTTPSVSDTALAGEYTTTGLTRALGTYAHTAGQSNYTVSFTFTATGAAGVSKTALFTAPGPPVAGTMPFESLEASTSQLNSGDSDTQITTVSI
jgi:hypothetical protein